jgi:hypothetical protein
MPGLDINLNFETCAIHPTINAPVNNSKTFKLKGGGVVFQRVLICIRMTT